MRTKRKGEFLVQTKIKVPVISSAYRNVYLPSADVYRGINTPSFQNGVKYDHWIVNDFTMIKDGGDCWHAYGITHPKPPTFTDDFHFVGDVHEAEYQLFHCTFNGTLEELCNGESFIEQEKVLYPQSRPGERPECWAPCIVEKDELYYLFYTPETVHIAKTSDMYHFTPHPNGVFSGDSFLRDPYVFFEDGIYTMIYVTENLYCRTSIDLIHWGEEQLFQANPFGPNSSQESPCLFKRHGIYYLMWCIYDGQNGCYDNRTYIFAANSLNEFTGKAPIAMLKGHAPEIISENGQDYIVSVYYPQNGLNIAKIMWE